MSYPVEVVFAIRNPRGGNLVEIKMHGDLMLEPHEDSSILVELPGYNNSANVGMEQVIENPTAKRIFIYCATIDPATFNRSASAEIVGEAIKNAFAEAGWKPVP